MIGFVKFANPILDTVFKFQNVVPPPLLSISGLFFLLHLLHEEKMVIRGLSCLYCAVFNNGYTLENFLEKEEVDVFNHWRL